MGILQGSFVDICFSVDSRHLNPNAVANLPKFVLNKNSHPSELTLFFSGGLGRGVLRPRLRWRSYSTVLRVLQPVVLGVAFWMLISSLGPHGLPEVEAFGG